MNFFEHQARARSATKRLVFMFVLAVGAIVGAVTMVVVTLLSASEKHPTGTLMQRHGDLVAMTALVTLAIIVLASLYKSMTLRSGGGAVPRALGATRIPSSSTDLRLQRLRNVVEEIAIASGTPVPEIYVMEQEQGINAFAAGWSPADAAVCVTRGTLDKLSRDELQGVIAHEFSHVVNGDMRLNIRLMGVLFGILVIAIIGREVLDATSRSRRGDSRSVSNGVALAALGVMLIGYIGLFFGRLIKAGVSRSREFLADSSAVQFTRQTSGIAGALKKIAGIDAGSKLQSARGEEVSHMLFGDGVGYSALFATHPPLLERIRRLEPQFKPEQLDSARWNEPGYVADDPASDRPVTSGLAAGGASLNAAAVASQVGQPAADSYRHAEAVHASIPPVLMEAAHDQARALPLLLALLLDDSATTRGQQCGAVSRRLGAATAEAAERCRSMLADLAAPQRLPLAALAFPALRQHPRADLEKFLLLVSELIRADGQVGMFEFCLGNLLRVQVADTLFPTRAKAIGRGKLGAAREPAIALLAVLAQQGDADARRAQQAFAAGIGSLFGSAAIRYEPPAAPADVLQPALTALDGLDAPGKQMLVEAMVRTLMHDQKITVGEAELLRAVCGCIHCPLPPVLAA